MGMAYIIGQMAQFITATGLAIKYRDKVLINGMMAGHTKDSGRIMTCMAKECTSGPTAGCTREATSMTRKKGMVYMFTQMDVNMQETGRKESNMEKAISHLRPV